MTQYIFFSYARQDSDFVLKLGTQLRERGARLWLDQLDIAPGARWDDAIEKALADCSHVVAILSPASVDSNNVMDEVSYALEEGKQVIPVLYRECEIPFRLRRLQHIDFRSNFESAFARLSQYVAVNSTEVMQDSSLAQTPAPAEVIDAHGHDALPRARVQSTEPVASSVIQNRSRPRPAWVIGVASAGAVLALWAGTRIFGSSSAPGTAQRADASTTLPAPAQSITRGIEMRVVSVTENAGSPDVNTAGPQQVASAYAENSQTQTAHTKLKPVAKEKLDAKALHTAFESAQLEPHEQLEWSDMQRARIINAKSGLCLTVAGSVKDRNADIVQFPCDDDPARFWSITLVKAPNIVEIRNLNSGLCLTIAGGVTDNNTRAVQYPCDGDPSRRWRVSKYSQTTYRLVNAHSGLCLTMPEGTTDRNANSVQLGCEAESWRHWRLKAAETAKY